MRPRVSVLVPVHDAAATLGAALESVRGQSLADHEVVLVLNGCTDGTAEVAARCAAADRRVRVLTLPVAGLVAALQRGLSAARAPFVARHDADDRMLPDRLATQEAALRAHPEWIAVTCGVRHVAPPGGPPIWEPWEGSHALPRWNPSGKARRVPARPGAGMARFAAWLNSLTTPEAIRAARFIDAPVAHPAVMFRAASVRAAGGYHDGPFPEDHELWLRLFERGATVGRVPEVLVEWHDRPDRLTRVDPRYARGAARALVHRFLLRGPLAGGRRCRVWGAGPYGRVHARELRAGGALVDDFIDIDPRAIGRRRPAGLVVRGPETVGAPDGRLIVVAVATPGAREEVTAYLRARGHAEERDFLAVQ